VPGEVHLDAMRAGWIGDPLVGTNCLAARWIEECLWSYRREFVAPPEALVARAWLVFEGLDLVARIFLNGAPVATHANAFYPCRVEVTGKLRAGANRLVVLLDSGLCAVASRPWPEADPPLWRWTKPSWLRKPLSQFNCDWGPRLLNVGIYKSVRLEWTDAPCRADQTVITTTVSEDHQRGGVRVRQFVEAWAAACWQLDIEVVETGQRESAAGAFEPGHSCCEARLEVARPGLWWPAGHGEPRLHTVRVTLRVHEQVVAQATRRVGFRRAQFAQPPHPERGRYFTLEINGRKTFCKGANLIPADVIAARLDRARAERLVAQAREAHFNFVRVWGGGVYESDEFYERCDEHGLMVWQDFAFANLRYPVHDAEWLQNVTHETTYQVRRLASHPSLVAWCGNNEIELAYWDARPPEAGHSLFHLVLPRLVAAEDGTRYYQPSSPYSPDLRHPNDPDAGDQHPWAVGFQNNDFRDYRRLSCRFALEGGVLGPRPWPTLLACLPDGPPRRLDSLAWRIHDNAIDGGAEPSATDAMVEQWLGRRLQDLTLAEFAYWGGLLQAEALSEYVLNFRRRMFDCSAAVFWMFNDCWPATRSWAIVDYYGRRCPSFYAVRRAMQPISVVVAEAGQDVCVFGINDTNETISADLRFGLCTMSGRYPLDRTEKVTLAPNASTRLTSFPRSSWREPHESAAFAMLLRRGALLARHRLFLPLAKEMRWSPMKVAVRLQDGQAVFDSATFVWGVCLDLDGERALADNFFDIYPGVPYRIDWDQSEPPRVLHVGDLTPQPTEAR
jgi:beta-mannosidase